VEFGITSGFSITLTLESTIKKSAQFVQKFRPAVVNFCFCF
jgi:hypothetical protein